VKPPAPLATFWPLDSLPPLTMMTRAAPVEVAGSGWTTCAVEVDVTVTLGESGTGRILRALISEALTASLLHLDSPLQGDCPIVYFPVGDVLLSSPTQPPIGSHSLAVGAVTRRPIALILSGVDAAEVIAVRTMVYITLGYVSHLITTDHAAALLHGLKVRLTELVSHQ